MMRKSLLLTPLLLGALSANAWAQRADLYFGMNLFGSENKFDFEAGGYHERPSIGSKGFALKFGAVLYNGWRLQGYLLGEYFDEPLFDDTNDELYELGLDVIKTFDTYTNLYPFIQAGIGSGSMQLDSYYYPHDDSIGEVSLKVGMGLIFRIAPQLEVMGGVDFQWRTWQDVEYYYPVYNKLSTDDSSVRYYGGFNFLF
ncbi:outer membrane beta-barrel protein [Sulfurimonas diazotrophicus]|uniref:Outer membrane protein beta-barrel domain-containing protein n=1 Tax=Sulfurimonas diazotrophicus TaxID=3131939 RepID=A0ABZ3HBU9_9BACT